MNPQATHFPINRHTVVVASALGILITLLPLEMSHAQSKRIEKPPHLNASTLPVLTTNGQRLPLGQLSPGRPAVVIVMKSSQCPTCLTQLHRLAAQKEELRRIGANVIGLVAYNNGVDLVALAKFKLGVSVVAMDRDDLQQLGFASSDSPYARPGLLFLDSCGNVVEQRIGRLPKSPEDKYIFNRLRNIVSQPSKCGTLI